MVGSVNKARMVLKHIRQNIDDATLFANGGDPIALALIQVSSDLCDVLTMLVEEARPSATESE